MIKIKLNNHLTKYFKFAIIFIVIFFAIILNYTPVAASNSDFTKKVVYLTFDDGPNENITKEIVNILESNNIKGSFFLIGDNANNNKGLVKLLKEKNMTIMPHTNIHKYNEIYSSTDEYFNDLNKCEETISNIIGKRDFKFIRMPGGSDNTIGNEQIMTEIKNRIKSENRYYIDWSVDSGDTEEQGVSVNFIDSRIKEYGGLYPVEVVLMHDISGKETTIAALQNTINFYKEKGYKFKSLDEIEDDDIEYLKKIKVINK
ncbi:polysaccharide deacetylase family protein [Clostridium chauvoei]|uniref:Putative Peptidoglycan N-acetylglucosamine deacetylase n=1 Tax=Clostridium chauvoei JF4335 TaxID=1351755 RepID=S6ELP9_9CLOT|nr:polysaccharide deacetylase family protein [Clostridium chauvoei]CDG02142.1 Putative Peptidoglycan N-acetylglucosamine deacetylase [Clostridium chauvoei JF4335]SLK19844.1 Putative Peptidoglycan N-acetylglucosamine deacetylase [Clostridium chauvoei JF4335]